METCAQTCGSQHTFGRRLRAAGISVETRKVLLEHRCRYHDKFSVPELRELIEATNSVCEMRSDKRPARVILHLKTVTNK